ncbi:MAG: AAA family ATPase [Gammaproteobacteria bacterium]|nr:MAG: AAA family ATPase [Gammaproteobacteria bacterium]
MKCPNCHNDTKESAKFCEECGTRLIVACGSCGTELSPAAKFCSECGTAAQSTQSPAPEADAPVTRHPAATSRTEDVAAERRQLTVMFCDIVGSTELSEKLDPEILREVVHSYHDTTGRVIGRYEGHNAQYLGDGLLVYFGYPIAHDDDAERAVRAGREIITALSEMNVRLEKEHGTTISVRVGIHTGPVVIGAVGYGGRQENLALGSTTNIAARFESAAEPNTVLISETTLRLIPGLFVTEEVPMPPLKGVTTPIRGYVVRHPSGVGSSLVDTVRLTPLVGRELEVGLCLDRWEMVQDGAGQALLISGDAGIGKSRLLTVLRERLADTPHTWLECRGSYYMRHTAFQPVTELLQQAVGFQATDTVEIKLERLRKGLEITGVSVEDTLPLLAALLSLPLSDGQDPVSTVSSEKRKETIAALVGWIHAVAATQPLVLIVEDLHWCDPSTVEFLGILIEQIEASRVMVVVAFRPEAKLPWPGRSNQTPVVLSPLRRSQVTSMITSVAGGRSVSSEMAEFIIDKAGGIPLYVEEITKMMIESEQVNLVDGRYELVGQIDTLSIPTTLKDSLMARLDSRADAKELAQLAAVIGREFGYSLIETVTDLDESDLRRRLAELVAAELFYQRGVIPAATFTFKHALIQDTAYQSLLRSARRRFHARIAQVLESDFPELVIARPEMMAQHCETGGLAEQALEYYVRAGDAAAMRSANREAIHHYEGAIKTPRTLPDVEDRSRQHLNLLMMISGCQMSAFGWGHPDVANTHKRIQKVYKNVDDPTLGSEALLALTTAANVRAEFDQALQLAADLLNLGESANDPSISYMPECQLGVTSYLQGKLSVALKHFELADERYDNERHLPLTRYTGYDIKTLAQAFSAMVIWLRGFPDQAIAKGREAVETADTVQHFESAVIARCLLAWVLLMRGEPSAAMAPSEDAVHTSQTRELKFLEGFGRTMLGLATAAAGNEREGIEEYRNGCQIMAEAGARFNSTGILSKGAAACLHAGDLGTAKSALEIASAFRDATGELFWESELQRLNGEICLAGDDIDESEAEQHFQQALEIARGQGAKSFELRAAMSLARLWQKQGKQQDALDLLAPIHDWFAEGLDTGDLKDADALLKMLGDSGTTAAASN